MNARQGGFSMIEVLVTIAILMIGLLGLAALQTNATIAEIEAYQRSQALVLVQDMADRIAANKANAADYVISNTGATVVSPCPTSPPIAATDLCEWGNKLAGAAEVTGGGNSTVDTSEVPSPRFGRCLPSRRRRRASSGTENVSHTTCLSCAHPRSCSAAGDGSCVHEVR